MANILEVRNLTVEFDVEGGVVHAVTDVSYTLGEGETLGIVGESGCGKSTIGRAVTMLVPPTSGSIRFEDEEITGLTTAKLRPIRRRFQMGVSRPVRLAQSSYARR